MYVVPEEESEVLISGNLFPLRAQCVALLNPDPERLSPHADTVVIERNEPGTNDYDVSFQGCGETFMCI